MPTRSANPGLVIALRCRGTGMRGGTACFNGCFTAAASLGPKNHRKYWEDRLEVRGIPELLTAAQ